MTLGGIPMNENYMDLLTHNGTIGHTDTSILSHSAEQKTMQYDTNSLIYLQEDNDLDAQIAEAAAAQSSYDEWKTQLAADCHASGIAFPSSYALQRAWNVEQKKRAEQRKQDKKKDAIRARIAQLQSLLGEAKKELADQDGQTIDFDALDAELLRVQEQRAIAEKQAQREQQQLFGKQSDEGTKLHQHNYHDPDDI
jgi:Na+-translocating ferredoxin:NAD+ oxidoreductase RnfC subunit